MKKLNTKIANKISTEKKASVKFLNRIRFKYWKTVLALTLVLFFLPQILSLKPLQKGLFALIGKTSSLQIETQTVSFSWFSSQVFKNLKIRTPEFYLSAEKVVFKKPFLALFHLKKSTFFSSDPALKIHKGRLRLFHAHSKTTLNLEGQIQTSPSGLKIELQGDGETDEFFHFQGRFNSAKSESQGNLVFKNLPTFLADKLLKSQNFYQTFLGKNCSGQITFQIKDKTGPIDLDLTSTHYHGQLFLTRTPLGITLRQPAVFSLFLHSNQFGKDLSHFVISYFKSLTPLTLSIPKDGLFLPLPFDLKKLVLEKAVLDLGKIKINSNKNFALLLSLLKDHKLAASQEIELWCAPTVLNLKEGLLETSRLDILMEKALPICTIGKIDLLKSKIDMSLGITAATLKHSFQIKHLPPDYVLAIPLTGSLKKIKINKKQIATKIATLMGFHQKSVLEKFSLEIQSIDEEKVFPPSIEQLPWEN